MDKSKSVEKLWQKLEAQTEKLLLDHRVEVDAVAQALLERNDLTGKQCVEIIQAAANDSTPPDSERLLKDLVEETIVNPEREEKKDPKPRPKRKTIKAKAED